MPQRALGMLDPRIKSAYEGLDSNVARETRKSTYFKVQLGMDHRDGKAEAGDAICEVMCQGGFSSVHRANFLNEMVALLPEEVKLSSVTFGHRVVDVEVGEGGIGVLLRFANGNTATADAVIGCDGIKSEIRKVVLGRASTKACATFTGKYAYRGLIPTAEAAAPLGDRQGKIMNVVAFRTIVDGEWNDGEWVKSAERKDMDWDFQGWGSDVQKILGMMQKCDMWALFDHSPATTYHKDGKVCLMGTPHMQAHRIKGLELGWPWMTPSSYPAYLARSVTRRSWELPSKPMK